MSTSSHSPSASPSAGEAYVLADHPALDLLNTGGLAFDGKPVETLHRDSDVLRWLVRVGLPAQPDSGWQDGELVQAAVRLRETVRAMLASHKAGRRPDPAALNGFLAVPETTRLVWPPTWPEAGAPFLSRQAEGEPVQRLLLPLARAAAELFVAGDFSLVRQCEHPECVLWFYDRTKSHRRRWCSMAICGNRHKVSQFRRRQGG